MDRRVLCARPTCGSVAQAALHYDYAARTAWLDALEADLPLGAWSICAAHAEGLRVPSGWKLVDRRPPAGTSGRVQDGPGPDTPGTDPTSGPAGDRPKPGGPPGLSFRPPLAV